jgi:hypothetical protein
MIMSGASTAVRQRTWPGVILGGILIGILLSVQLMVDGIMLILVGRPVPARASSRSGEARPSTPMTG